ncbi:MAG: polysaccharide pyruvyl transferase CsaB [Clostridia bacterium]|nr:polysaccharide pyruvyl transferase CsaB [Clostridia bacterium]
MKILMVTMSMNIGGAETHILELCRELRQMNHHVTLASFGGVYAEEAAQCGVVNVQLPLHTKKPGAVLEAYRGLEKLIRVGNFDLVHAHARIPAFITGLLWDRMKLEDGRKFRFVTTAHLNFSVNPLWRKISRWGERVMCVSEDIGEYLVSEYGFPRDRIHYTINGVDCVKFSPDVSPAPVLEQWGLDPSRRRIVYMSRLDADRADPAYRLLGIAPELAEKYPDTDLIIVGGGTELEAIQAKAGEVNKKLGRNTVIVTGAVSNTNEYCAAADVFVGVSRSLLEAMAAEKPVIAAGNQGSLGIFDESKIADGVNTNFCCRGFPQATEDDLMRDLSALLDADPEKLCEMGRFNRAFIEENYTAARMARDYTAMYEQLLASPVPFRGDPDVVVSGYYGFGNLGDESLLDVISSSLAKEVPGVKIAALTKKPKADAPRTGLMCVSRFRFPKVWRIIGKSKLLISGGGSLLQDITSKRSLTYYAWVIRAAERQKTRVAVLANGIGPITYPSNEKLTAKVISAADEVSVRDCDSGTELIRIGVDPGKIRISADPAFLIRPADEDAVAKTMAALGVKGGFFAVSVRPLGKPDEDAAENQQVIRETASACGALAERYGLTPVIIPMQEVQDGRICESLCDMLKDHGAVIYRPGNASLLIGVLAHAQMVMGMRLHLVIFASSAGVPVIGLSYDPKVNSMLRQLGQEHCVDLVGRKKRKDFAGLAEEIVNHADSVMADRDAIGKLLAAKAEEMRTRCREDFARIREMIK